MKLSEVKNQLQHIESVNFVLENGQTVPEHFHVTEVGLVTKHFIDCGGTVRTETVANFQLWDANDYDHRLKPAKLLNIITLSEKVLQIPDLDVEVEYQQDTIGKYALNFNGKDFVLTVKQTACLAQDQCGVPQPKQKIKLTELTATNTNCCTPGGGCC
jgi:Family of unknown function (DUF6428)